MSICHCFFFIDACGFEVLRGQDAFTCFGEARPLRSVFGYSSACVPSILSGLYPDEHLHWNFYQRCGPGLRVPRWLHWIPGSIRDRGRVRAKLSRFVKQANNIEGYFQLYQMPLDALDQYSTCEKRNIFQPGGLNAGRSIVDTIQELNSPAWVSDWHKPESETWRLAGQAAADPKIEFLFVYAASLDAWLHDHTRQHPDLPGELQAIAQRINQVLDAARANHDEVRFHIFSDHGMATINEHLDLFPALQQTGLRLHRDFHAVIDSTMLRCWYPDEATRARVRDALSGYEQITLLDDAYLQRERCLFPDRRFGEDIWLARPHCLLVPSHMGTVPLAAMHGYDVEHEDSYASYLSNDPAAAPAAIPDIHGLMLDALHEIQSRRQCA